ncbi:MAG: DUF4411 family protein [Balneolaceae bacterium]
MAGFVLDSNIFIQAHRLYYPLDIADSFWTLIKQLARDGKIISIDKVRDEIYRNDDDLSTWMKANIPEEFFQSTNDEQYINELAILANWAESRSDHYKRKAIDEFLEFDRADAWLISYCKATNNKLVTSEVSNAAQKSRIPIPQPCNDLGVEWLNMIEMFRELGVRF